jgi:hypothetical protein
MSISNYKGTAKSHLTHIVVLINYGGAFIKEQSSSINFGQSSGNIDD